jgi:hypothetical protein
MAGVPVIVEQPRVCRSERGSANCTNRAAPNADGFHKGRNSLDLSSHPSVSTRLDLDDQPVRQDSTPILAIGFLLSATVSTEKPKVRRSSLVPNPQIRRITRAHALRSFMNP